MYTDKGASIGLDTLLKEEAGLDSLEVLMVTNALETEFKIVIEYSEIFDIKTVRDIANALRKRIPDEGNNHAI